MVCCANRVSALHARSLGSSASGRRSLKCNDFFDKGKDGEDADPPRPWRVAILIREAPLGTLTLPDFGRQLFCDKKTTPEVFGRFPGCEVKNGKKFFFDKWPSQAITFVLLIYLLSGVIIRLPGLLRGQGISRCQSGWQPDTRDNRRVSAGRVRPRQCSF